MKIYKEKKDKEKIIKTFDEEPDLQVLNGRYGPYIVFRKSNYKIPKKTNPEELTLETCKKIIEEADKEKTPKKTKPPKTVSKKASQKKT